MPRLRFNRGKSSVHAMGERAYHHVGGYWANNNEPEPATVKAWRDMPDPARGFYDRGKLTIPGLA